MKNENFCLWLLGPTSSGKTTIAENLNLKLEKDLIPVIHYDGDEVRNFFGSNFGFKEENRLQVVKTIVHLVNKSLKVGLNVIVSALTANNDARDFIINNIDNLTIGYVKCSIDECARRDPKGLYQKAQNGEISTLVGYSSIYREPEHYDLVLNSQKHSVDECVGLIEKALRLKKYYNE